MKVRIQCPHCNKIITIPPTLAGKKGRCPGCKQVIQIPTSLAPEEPAPQEDIYDAEDASVAPPPPAPEVSSPSPIPSNPSPAPSPSPPESSDDELGYALSSDLLSELDNQPAISTDGTDQVERYPCPVCKEMIVRGAAKCHHCGEIFDLVLKAHEKHRQSEIESKNYHDDGDDNLEGWEIVLAILCGDIAFIIAIVWMIQGKGKGVKLFGICLLVIIIHLFIYFACNASGPRHIP